MGQLIESIETLPVNVFLYSEDLGSDKIKSFPGALQGTKEEGWINAEESWKAGPSIGFVA